MTMAKYQHRSFRRTLLTPYFGHPRAPRGSHTAVRRLGTCTIITKHFFVPNQDPAFAWSFGNGLVRVGIQRLFRLCLKTFVAPFLPTRMTAPWSPRMYFGESKIIFITHIVIPQPNQKISILHASRGLYTSCNKPKERLVMYFYSSPVYYSSH